MTQNDFRILTKLHELLVTKWDYCQSVRNKDGRADFNLYLIERIETELRGLGFPVPLTV